MIMSVAPATAVFAIDDNPFLLAVVAPDDDEHFAWAGALQLKRNAKIHAIEITIEQASLTEPTGPQPLLFIMPVRSLASQVPALQILELPFFYPALEDLHQLLDNSLGQYLSQEANQQGWEILSYWDEGMHIFSGLKRYDRMRNLKAREFLITRPDPVAEQQFRYWKADARRIEPEDRQTVLRECLIASRAATLQEIVREQLYRVHLSMSLTNHRYEGWVVVAATERWTQLNESTRKQFKAILQQTTSWQRNDSLQREAAALDKLQQSGMTIHEVDPHERDAFRKALPEWTELLPDSMDMQKKRKLIDLARISRQMTK